MSQTLTIPSVGPAPVAERQAYLAAIDFLFGRIDYERAPQRARSIYDFKLTRMERLLARLGDPHLNIPAVHIAGTKGKGSTATMIARMLEAAGFRTGLFTSPHMTSFEERMSVNGRLPTPCELVDLVERIREATAAMDLDSDFGGPTFFELATALGWLYFLQQGASVAVLEVGLGGRLDSTNLCRPLVTAITSISRDHMRLLGNTLESIAREKGGIIKPNVPVVLGEIAPGPLDVLVNIASERRAPMHRLGEEIKYERHPRDEEPFRRPVRYRVSVESALGAVGDAELAMPGEHQARNAAIAVTLAQVLSQQGWAVSELAIRTGLATAVCPLRTEVLGEKPLLIVDAAHNEASVAALTECLQKVTARRRIVIFGASRDKDVPAMLREIAPLADELVLTRYLNNPRATALDDLRQLVDALGPIPYRLANSPREALATALAVSSTEDLICTTGSFFLAAEMRELITVGVH